MIIEQPEVFNCEISQPAPGQQNYLPPEMSVTQLKDPSTLTPQRMPINQINHTPESCFTKSQCSPFYEIAYVVKPKEPSSQRVFCDLLYLIEQARELEHHGYKCSGRFYCEKIEQKGLVTWIHYKCNKPECSEKKVICSEKKCNGLNNLAVLGALSTGSGFAQEEEKFATMGIKYMSQPLFVKCERISGEVIASYTEAILNQAISEEKQLAEASGSIDSKGYICITVIVDGGWCKRSYGHGYNASSGVAVIIGAATQKVVFVGVRNKLCLLCNAIADGKMMAKKHVCFRNWSGASTAMEPDIIVEGINYLEKVHNVHCTKLVGDGDSSTMSAVREKVSFGRTIRKIECANHAVRRYSRALNKLSSDTKRFCGRDGIIARKLLSKRIPRLAIGARAAIINHAIPFHSIPTPQAIENLKKELRNGPSHVFGCHFKCGDFCKRKEDDPEGDVSSIVHASGVLSAVEKTVNQVLVCDANTLIFNATNNPAETFMSQLAKTYGGKRVDHSKAGGINRRSRIATLAYQARGQEWHAGVHKELLGESPKTPLRRFILQRKRVHERQLAKRRLFQDGQRKNKPSKRGQLHIAPGGDQNYGDNPTIPDITPGEMKEQCEYLLSKLAVKERDELEQVTLEQADNDRWREERSNRLSSTKFKRVACRKPYTSTHNIVKDILYSDIGTGNRPNKAMQHGKNSEPIALLKYIEVCGHTEAVRSCGMFIDPEHPYLCSSPDALVGSCGLLEIKCPFTALNTRTISEAAANHQIGLKISKETGELLLPESHQYYFQIQGQLAITDRDWCDLFYWSPSDNITIRVFRKRDFWNRILPTLSAFYKEVLLPEIVDPRVPRHLLPREMTSVEKAIEDRKKLSKMSPILNVP